MTGGLISAGTSIVGGLLGSSAAKRAAAQQAQSQQKVIDYSDQAQKDSLSAIQSYQDAQQKAIQEAQARQDAEIAAGQGDINAQQALQTGNLDPYIKTGQEALARANDISKAGFQAPTGLTESNDPGFQARLALGMQALQRSAAAKGNVLTGGTADALNKSAQDYASNEYGNVYNRALTGYQTAFNNAKSLSDTGLNAGSTLNSNIGSNTGLKTGLTGTGVNTLGQNLGTNVNTLGQNLQTGVGVREGTAQTIAGALTGQGNAQAAGTVGSTNALTGALGNIGNSAQSLALFNSLYKPQQQYNPNANYYPPSNPSGYVPNQTGSSYNSGAFGGTP